MWSARPALEPLETRLTPSVFPVTNTRDDGSTGSLNWAVEQANQTPGSNTIDFEGSVFTTPQTITLKPGGQLTLSNYTTTIQGPGAGMLTVNGYVGRVFNVLDFATVTITGLTISNGSVYYAGQPGTGSGGAIDNRGVLTVSDCTFSNNSSRGSAGYGGAIASGGFLTVNNCLFNGNTASTNGGAIWENTTYGTTVTGCTFTGNTAGTGGGAIYSGGTLTVSGCTFSNNSAYTAGGAIVTDLGSNTTLTGSTFSGDSATATVSSSEGGGVANNGTMAVSGCTFSGNSAGGGGGIVNFGPLTVTSSTFSGNSSFQTSGGALYTDHPLTVTCSTLSGNSAPFGGGISNNSGADAPVTLTSCIVAANTASYDGPDYYGPVQSASSYNLIGNGSAMSGISSGSNNNQVGSAASPINPRLASLGLYGGTTQTQALLPGSPALGAGNPNAQDPGGNVITTDQRGVARTVNGRTDVGAFESQGFTLTYVSGSGQTAPVATAFPNPLVVQVAPAAAGEPVAGGQVTFSGPGSGAGLAPPTTVVPIAANGQVSLTATANTAAGSYAVTANAVGAAAPVGFNLTNTAGAADHLAFLVQPGHGVAQIPLYPPVQAQIFDAYGNPLTADNTDQLTLTVASGPGAFTAGSTTTVTVSGGIATFSNLALTAAGTYTLGETGTGGLTGPNSNSFTIDPQTPITLTQNPQINGDRAALAGAQRSMVDDIVYTFNQPVELGANAFTIALHANVTVNGVGGQTVGTLPTLTWATSDGGRTWVVTFSGAGVVGGSIADGVYDLTLNAAAVTAVLGGATLAGNDTETFYRLTGDALGFTSNGNEAAVTNTDLALFKLTLGKSPGQAGYRPAFDFLGGGLNTINNTDLALFKLRLGTTFAGFTPTI